MTSYDFLIVYFYFNHFNRKSISVSILSIENHFEFFQIIGGEKNNYRYESLCKDIGSIVLYGVDYRSHIAAFRFSPEKVPRQC